MLEACPPISEFGDQLANEEVCALVHAMNGRPDRLASWSERRRELVQARALSSARYAATAPHRVLMLRRDDNESGWGFVIERHDSGQLKPNPSSRPAAPRGPTRPRGDLVTVGLSLHGRSLIPKGRSRPDAICG